jgi:hypothetical protein
VVGQVIQGVQGDLEEEELLTTPEDLVIRLVFPLLKDSMAEQEFQTGHLTV